MKQLENVVKAIQAGEEFVLATIVEAEGSTPGRTGFRMIVYPDRLEGTIGGGALEYSIAEKARTMLADGSGPQLIALNLSELKMECGGRVAVFLEPFGRKTPVWIFGAGHIARALAPILSPVGFRVTVVDNRPGFAVGDAFPAGMKVITREYGEVFADVPPQAYAVIVTHGHLHDEEILIALASKEPKLPYIGMIGSRKKVLVARGLLEQKGLGADNVYAPIGLNIGGDSPAEIAVAIAAEILGIVHKKANLPHCRLA